MSTRLVLLVQSVMRGLELRHIYFGLTILIATAFVAVAVMMYEKILDHDWGPVGLVGWGVAAVLVGPSYFFADATKLSDMFGSKPGLRSGKKRGKNP